MKNILDEFLPSEKLAILYRCGDEPTVEKIKEITERQWRYTRGIGNRFIAKLAAKGWLGEREKMERKNYSDKTGLELIEEIRSLVLNNNKHIEWRLKQLEKKLKKH